MQFANLTWHGNTPYSLDFNDIYFSTDDGPQETKHVFITQNQLKVRFSSLKNKQFTVIETGFGTGLNFYCTVADWLALAPLDTTLHYISIEKFPLNPEDMQRIANFWPQFALISNEFLPQYANLKPNSNNMSMADNRIQLALWAGDILEVLPQISQKADAWFLDGFAPAKNTDMWSKEVFEHIARLSTLDTTFATFTSAGAVRRGLQNVGFDVQKQAGFGKKREMLSGKFR